MTKKVLRYSGIMAIVAADQKLSDNHIQQRIDRAESNAVDSAAMARKFRKESGLLNKKESKLFKKQARLLERQSRNDQIQAELYRKHLRLSKKFN